MARFLSIVRQLPLAILSPFAALVGLLALWAADLAWLLFGKRRPPSNTRPDHAAASVVIPNWNGRDLLEKYLPSVVQALAGNAGNEIIVVENGSTDGSAEYVRENFPQIRLLALL